MTNLWWRNFYLGAGIFCAVIAALDSLDGEIPLTVIAMANVVLNLALAWRSDLRARKEKRDGRAK
jgi:hypothetical protein